jgi:cell division protein FtsN
VAAGTLRSSGREEVPAVPARRHPLPLARALVLGLLPVCTLAACSYTEARPDAAAARSTAPAPADVRRDPVVGALPSIGGDTTLPVAPPGAADDSAPLPGEETTVAETTPPPEDAAPATAPPTAPPTTPPATAASGPTVALQAGSFKEADGASRFQAQLKAAGFDGFTTLGNGPFRVVRTGLSESTAGSLRQRLSAAGFESFVVRS